MVLYQLLLGSLHQIMRLDLYYGTIVLPVKPSIATIQIQLASVLSSMFLHRTYASMIDSGHRVGHIIFCSQRLWSCIITRSLPM